MEKYTISRASKAEPKLSIDDQRSGNFLTGTKFFGEMNELGMQDYGTYLYPDGTRYVGYFRNNRFHGRGSIQLPPPVGVNFEVTHENGKLVEIDEMVFDDQLKVDFTRMADGAFSFQPWKYCTSEDRRFYAETRVPLAPVGPAKYLTKDGPTAAELPKNVFDLGYGQLNPQGFLMDLRYNTQSIYVGCRKVRHWITEHCRHGRLSRYHLKRQVKERSAREIMQNNLEVSNNCGKKSGRSVCPPMPMPGICRRSKSQESSESAKETRLHAASTSDSCSTKVDRTVKREPRRKCRPDKVKRDQRRDTSESHVCRIN
ncbi:MORN repeat-containing protein 5 [Drosophila obscura]|uniref:MORN repeat-containing protein 5 n=1 Tax=Drosophila obscura TaxID=7282 RepID=UPI001BB22024|nr:MORN repeat-containing protein 5 [Drosophila obscura]